MRTNYFAVFGQQYSKKPCSVANWPLVLIRPVCGKELFRRIWPEILRKAQKAVLRCRMAHSTWFAQFVRKNYFRYLAIRSRMAHSTWFGKFVRKNYFALFGQQDSEKPKNPCSGAKWPIRLDSLSLWKRIISPYLSNKTPKTLKNSVHVQNGPLHLIRPVCEKELFRRIWQARLRKA